MEFSMSHCSTYQKLSWAINVYTFKIQQWVSKSPPPASPFHTRLDHVTGHEFKSALQVFSKLFFWPVQVSYECLQCIQLPKQVLWSPRTITANTKRQSEWDTVCYFNQSSISGRKRSGKGQEVGRSEGRGLLKETKPVSSPHAMVAHLFNLFFTTSRSLQSCPGGFRSTSLTIVPWKK